MLLSPNGITPAQTQFTFHSFEYAILLLACFIVPFFYIVIHRRVLHRYNYSLVNPTVFIAGLPFLLWDLWATAQGYWQFNPNYTTPWKIGGLPLEEYFFFLFIPQSCLLLWVAFKRYNHMSLLKTDLLQHFNRRKT